MRRSRTAHVPATRARLARHAATALVPVAVLVPVTAHARMADPAAPSAARPVASAAAPRAAIAITRMAPGSLAAVAATSSTNAWAVGDGTPAFSGPGSSPLILHWNGTAWTRQAAPALPAGFALHGVAARSSSDAWAVGGGGKGTLALHWNGSVWSRVATPAVGQFGQLNAVAMLSARSVWAFGTAAGRGGLTRLPLALHWNGRVWKRVRLPKLPAHFDGGFRAVSGSSPRNMWAVGAMDPCGCGGGLSLVMHWNGRSWKRLKLEDSGASTDCCLALAGVATVSNRRAFAVGAVGGGDGPSRAQAARFIGRHWRRQRTPSPAFRHDRHSDALNGVVATSSRNAWAVGFTNGPGFANGVHTTGAPRVLVERWNGRVWRQRPVTVALSPAVAHTEQLAGAAATSRRDAWAVGDVEQLPTFAPSALILHWNGAAWSAVPTAP